MRVPVLVYLILSQNFLHESLQKLILRFVAGLHVRTCILQVATSTAVLP